MISYMNLKTKEHNSCFLLELAQVQFLDGLISHSMHGISIIWRIWWNYHQALAI
uniref:Uncharacterized protein n=1 Tax=Arundo donax TaxID=35708 RepID=A0A0A9EJ67_ARUDO